MQRINFTQIIVLIWAVITLFFALVANISITAPVTWHGTYLENLKEVI